LERKIVKKIHEENWRSVTGQTGGFKQTWGLKPGKWEPRRKRTVFKDSRGGRGGQKSKDPEDKKKRGSLKKRLDVHSPRGKKK